ncbi:MAG TPA: MBL fold metallo-hydrolase [Dehalococcoidales bacterium]|nr:MBL fold metallo-hydrolase [Dehalococcoidales bacterium]
MEIINGIYLIDGIRGANSYLCTVGANVLVIDTGMPGNEERILQQVKTLDKSPKDVRVIILTHADIDHSGSAAALKKITGAMIAIHEGDAPGLAGKKELKKVKGLIGVIFRLMARFMKFQTVKADIILKDGDEITPLKVIHTPGHTEGSICLYIAGNTLFAGDALRTNNKSHLRLPRNLWTLNMQEAIKSVKKIADLDYDILLPGHGKPVVGKASAKVKKLLANDK